MMRYLPILIVMFFVNTSKAQESTPLYKGLKYNMPKKEAYKELKKNKELYKDISFGNGIVWNINRQNFTINNGSLKALTLNPKSSLFGLTHENAKVYLQNSFAFFESKNYDILIEPDNWDIPALFSSNNKHGLVLVSPDKTIVVELRSIEISYNSYAVNLGISNYNAYMKYLNDIEDSNEKAQNKTGF